MGCTASSNKTTENQSLIPSFPDHDTNMGAKSSKSSKATAAARLQRGQVVGEPPAVAFSNRTDVAAALASKSQVQEPVNVRTPGFQGIAKAAKPVKEQFGPEVPAFEVLRRRVASRRVDMGADSDDEFED